MKTISNWKSALEYEGATRWIGTATLKHPNGGTIKGNIRCYGAKPSAKANVTYMKQVYTNGSWKYLDEA